MSRRSKRRIRAAATDSDKKQISFLTDLGNITIEAAADEEGKPKIPRFSMVAYTGGAMRLAYWRYPVILDMAGAQIPAQSVPIRMNHDAAHGVGHTDSIKIEDAQLLASGAVSRDTEAAREIVASAKRGFPWQASVGASVGKYEFVKEGTTVAVNGRNFDGPVYVVRQWPLGEISFVDRGADANTSASVAASGVPTGKEMDMDFEKWLKAKGFDPASLSDENRTALEAMWKADVQASQPAPPAFGSLDAEIAAQKRKQDLETLAVKYVREAPASAETIREIAARATVDDKVSIKDAELQMLRATRVTPPHTFTGFAQSEHQVQAVHYEAALAATAKLPSLEKSYSADVLNRASDAFPRGLSIGEMLLAAAAQNGYRGISLRSGLKTALRAAFAEPDIQASGFSTLSLPGILGNVANKFLLDGFMSVEQAWRACCRTRPVKDFKQITSYRLSGGFEYDEVGPDGELKHGTVSEDSYTNQAKTYGRMFAITRQDIINDDLGALSDVPRRIGRGGALKLNTVFWTAFMDNSSFFTNARANYATGAGTALAAAGLKAAVTAFRKIKDPDSKPKGVAPKVLLVPVDLDIAARELVQTITWNSGGAADTAQIPNFNVLGTLGLVPVATEYLSDTAITGYSTTAWYLLANPNDIPVMEVVFLNGQENPIVESADADFDMLGIQFRGYYDFGAAKQDWRGGLKYRGT